MIYTEEMKKKINSVGLQVVEVKYFIKQIMKVVDALVEAIQKVVEQIRDAFGSLLDFNNIMQNMPPRQRYKFCRKLGIENYQCFFQRRQIYRARSCC